MYAQTADDIECPDAWLFCRKRYPNGLIWVLVFLPDGVKNTVATHGVSVFNDPNEVTCRGFNAHKIDESSVPDTLKIQQRGQNKKHFEIMPREPMTLDAYTEALAKIVAN